VLSPHGRDASIQSRVIYIFFRNSKWRLPPSWFSSYLNLTHSEMSIMWYLSSVPNLVQIFVIYSHYDRRHFRTYIHLVMSRDLISGFDFRSCGHIRVAVMHLPTNVGAKICIRSGVIDIFPKFTMAAAAILDFQVMWICHITACTSSRVPNLVQISVMVTEIDTLMLQIFIWWRHANWLPVSTFDHVVISAWLWCRYLYAVLSYWCIFRNSIWRPPSSSVFKL